MAENKFANCITEIFETKNQNTILVNNEVLNKIAKKMEDVDSLIEITVSTTSKKLPIMEVRISKGQGSTSEWTHATEEVILSTIKAFRTKNPELIKDEETNVEAITYDLQAELTAALIDNKCRYSYVAYKNREEKDCYMVTFYLSKNRRFKVSLIKDAETTKLINA